MNSNFPKFITFYQNMIKYLSLILEVFQLNISNKNRFSKEIKVLYFPSKIEFIGTKTNTKSTQKKVGSSGLLATD